jgi:hypothetical protein
MSDQSVKYQAINLVDVSGGMNTAQPANDIEDNQFVELKNMEYNNEGELTTRPGTTAISTDVATLGLKGVINNINLDNVQNVQYFESSQRLYICDGGATDAVYIVDVADPEKPEFLGSCQDATYLQFPTCVAEHGNYLCIADRFKTAVVVFDITDPGNPVYERSHVDATYFVWLHQIIREGNYLYCAHDDASANGALVVLDISDLGTGISESNKITSHSGGKYIAHVPETNRLYQTNAGTHELHIIDTTDPSAISLVKSFLDATELAQALLVEADESKVYVTLQGTDALKVIDATNEVTLTVDATLTDNQNLDMVSATWSYRRGNILLYPIYSQDTLTMVNVADPSTPAVIGSIAIPGRFDGIVAAVLVDDYIFCASNVDDYLMCLELQVPLPFQTIETDTSFANQFEFLRASANDRWIAAYEHVPANPVLRIFDREDATTVTQVDFATDLKADHFPAHTFDKVYDVCWNDSYTRLYVWCSLNASGQGGLLTYEFNSATGKIKFDNVATFTDGGGSGGAQWYPGDDFAGYIAIACSTSTTDNILIIKVENDAPTKVGLNTALATVPVKVQINPVDQVFYISSPTTLTVVDISDPTDPVIHDTISDTDTEDIVLQPDRKTIWGFDPQAGGTTIAEWDATDPLNLVKLHESTFNLLVSTMNWPWYDKDSDKLFLSSATDDALYVINVSSYPWIQEYIYIDSTGLPSPNALHVKDDHVFSADTGLISIVKAIVEQSFKIVWEISRVPLDEVWGVKHYGQKLAAASKTSDAITILNIEEPESIRALGYVIDATKLNGAVDLAWFGDGKYIIAACTNYGGVTVYDVSDPMDITEQSFVTATPLTACNAVVVDSDGAFAYVSAPGYLSVIDLRDPSNITLVAAVPDATKYAALDGLAFLNDNYLCGIGTNYVNVWDVQLPFSPYIVGFLNDASQPAMRCDSDGTYLFATTNAGNSVRIYDISDPSTPVFDNEITGLTGAYGIRYVPVDAVLWVGVPGLTKVSLYDVADPTAPVLLDDVVDADNAVGSKLIDAAGFDIYVPCSTIDRVSAFRVVGMPFRSEITSLFHLQNEAGVDALVMTEGNHVMTDVGSGVFEVLNGALKLPVDAHWRWAVLDGVLFGVHGAVPEVTDDDGVTTDYGYPQVVYWDGEASSLREVPNFPEQTVAATQLEVWNHRLFVLAGNSIYYSKLGDGTDFTHTTSGSMDVYPDDGDVSVGMKEHKGMLVIFKQKHIYRLLAGVPNTADSKWSLELVTRNSGAISGESIVSVLDDLIFLSTEGLTTLGAAERLGDFETVLLSKNIAELRGMKLSTRRFPAVYWPKKSQYWISVDTDDDGVLDKTYVLDMRGALEKKLKWTVFDGAVVGSAFAIVEVGGVNELYIGSDNLYKLDESVWEDDGVSYTTVIKSKEFDINLPSHRKELLRWGIEFVKRTAALTLSVDLNFDGDQTAVHTKSINAAAVTLGLPQFARTMVTGQRRFRRVQFEITNTGDEGFELESFYLELTPLTIKKARSL